MVYTAVLIVLLVSCMFIYSYLAILCQVHIKYLVCFNTNMDITPTGPFCYILLGSIVYILLGCIRLNSKDHVPHSTNTIDREIVDG